MAEIKAIMKEQITNMLLTIVSILFAALLNSSLKMAERMETIREEQIINTERIIRNQERTERWMVEIQQMEEDIEELRISHIRGN